MGWVDLSLGLGNGVHAEALEKFVIFFKRMGKNIESLGLYQCTLNIMNPINDK